MSPVRPVAPITAPRVAEVGLRGHASARDRADFSVAGLAALTAEEAADKSRRASEAQGGTASSTATDDEDEREAGDAPASAATAAEGDTEDSVAPGEPRAVNGQALDPRELVDLRQLQRRDREVRSHEAAHVAMAGPYALGGPSFSYQRGPDGRRYAIGGEVAIDVGPAATPEATIAKMRQVRRAALAPAEPSSADRAIASQAAATLAQAQAELRALSDEPDAATSIDQRA